MQPLIILYENEDWRPALESALAEARLDHTFWNLAHETPDLTGPPPAAVFWSRMSASAASRGHGAALETAAEVLDWLKRHGRRVINGTRALEIEVSKLAQYQALGECGIETPRTLAASGREELIAAAKTFPTPFIVKPDCGGKGRNVRLFGSVGELAAWAEAAGPEGARWLVQDYIGSADGTITRAEFVGGEFLYALAVDTSDGFELCPADECAIDADPAARPRFQIREGTEPPARTQYERFLRRNEIDIAGIEYIEDKDGRIVTYDVNVNTNYNSAAEARAGRPNAGMRQVTEYLTRRSAN